MRKYYSRFRILLMTFTLGLASVFAFNGSLKFSDEILVNLPETESGDVVIVFPKCRFEMPFSGGSGPDWTPPKNWTPPKKYIPLERLTKCVENSSY